MKTLITAIFILSSANAYAQSQPNLLETTNDARMRHSAERYEQYKSNNYQAPMGGYTEKFGDPAPAGTTSPGYVASPQPYNSGGNGLNSGNNFR